MSYNPVIYTFRDADGSPDDFFTQDYREALEHARETQQVIIENEYRWYDSTPLDDFRPHPVEGDDEDEEEAD